MSTWQCIHPTSTEGHDVILHFLHSPSSEWAAILYSIRPPHETLSRHIHMTSFVTSAPPKQRGERGRGRLHRLSEVEREGHPSGHNVHIILVATFAPPENREGGGCTHSNEEGHLYQIIVHIILVATFAPPKSREEVEVALIRTRRDISIRPWCPHNIFFATFSPPKSTE